MSRRRSRSKSYYSQAGEHIVDNKSKQLLFEEIQACALGRTILKPDERFSEHTADTLIEKHTKKRKGHGMIFCLVDRLRFEKSCSYRSAVTYREIKHFYEHSSKPDHFTLCVEDESNGKRSYESFKCKKIEDVALLHDTVNKASKDQRYLLKDAVPIRQISYSPERQNRSFDSSGKTIVISDENNRPYRRSSSVRTSVQPIHTRRQYRSPSPDEVYSNHNNRVVSIDRSRTHSSLGRVGIMEDVTYLTADSANGPRITSEGPIYLYVSRAPSTNNLDRSPEFGHRRLSRYN